METLVALVVLTTVTGVCHSDNGAHLPTSDARLVEDVPNYPGDAIHQALLEALPVGEGQIKFNKRIKIVPESAEQQPGITRVFGYVAVANQKMDSELPPCETDQQMIKPRQGLGANGEYRIIVNQPLYQQKIYKQMCKYEGKPCNEIEAHLRSGYQSICVQNYAQVELLTFRNDSSKNPLKTEVFQLPVSCDCYVKGSNFQVR